MDTEVDQSLRRLAWRCRRGMLELDLLLQPFVSQGYHQLDAAQRQAFATLLEYPDQEMLDLLLGREPATEGHLADVIEHIRHAAHP